MAGRDLGVLQPGQGCSGKPPGSSAICEVRLMKFKAQRSGALDSIVSGLGEARGVGGKGVREHPAVAGGREGSTPG